MATSDPCANAPLTPPEELEPSLTPRKKRGRRKLEHNEKNKGTYSNACILVVKHFLKHSDVALLKGLKHCQSTA